jgi:hypothetical protein
VDEARIEAIFQAMPLARRIGQHLVFSLTRSGTAADTRTRDRILRYFPGGGFVRQVTGVAVGDPISSARFLREVQSLSLEASGVPLLVATDQEGGVYSTMNGMTGGTDPLSPTAIGATGSPWVAFRQFELMGREIHALGIGMNFAPLLDTHHRWQNGNLNTRTFGPDPDLNTRLGVAAGQGLGDLHRRAREGGDDGQVEPATRREAQVEADGERVEGKEVGGLVPRDERFLGALEGADHGDAASQGDDGEPGAGGEDLRPRGHRWGSRIMGRDLRRDR